MERSQPNPCAQHSAGFQYITFKSYEGLGHYTVPREMSEVSNWLGSCLGRFLFPPRRFTKAQQRKLTDPEEKEQI
ncbi:lysophospholipase [Trifolium repens]|nr:lysophospholipase [Trifolium repens]